uniref:Uncharacterized protein n=1 Tax=Caenorhabditis japonica TaxID=281687 RepID=A0A8R1EJ61_CAEJA
MTAIGYVLDPNALMPIHHHHHHQHHPSPQPPTYEDSIKSHSPPKYDTTPATTNSTTFNSMELPISGATTARIDGTRPPRVTPIILHPRSMSDSCLASSFRDEDEEDERKSAR